MKSRSMGGRMKQVIGLGMVALPLVGIVLLSVYTLYYREGWNGVVSLFGITAYIALFFYLLFSD